MNIAIFGASGRVGRLTAIEALQRGHSVIGVIHSAKSLSMIANNPSITPLMKSRLELRQADVHNAQTVANSIKGCQAVISALGSWGTPSKDIVASGMRTIIPAMKKENINRIVSLTGTEAYDKDDTPDLARRLAHAAASIAAGRILQDGEEHIKAAASETVESFFAQSATSPGFALRSALPATRRATRR